MKANLSIQSPVLTKVVTTIIIMTSASVDKLGLVNLLRLTSPALPIGAFAYSQGLEGAIHEGHLKNREDTELWLKAIYENNICQLDIPVLSRLYRAFKEDRLVDAIYWNQFLLASRETFELTKEEKDMGMALGRLLRDLGHPNPIAVERPGFICQFAWAGVCWQIEEGELLTGYGYSWLENQIAAATKLVPLGQTDAQRAISNLSEMIIMNSKIPLADHELGQSLPGLAAMSSRHETQEARLFRS